MTFQEFINNLIWRFGERPFIQPVNRGSCKTRIRLSKIPSSRNELEIAPHVYGKGNSPHFVQLEANSGELGVRCSCASGRHIRCGYERAIKAGFE